MDGCSIAFTGLLLAPDSSCISALAETAMYHFKPLIGPKLSMLGGCCTSELNSPTYTT